MQLLEWQNKFITWWKSKAANGVLWADTGMGKGVLGTYLAMKFKKCLIITPPHLVGDWKGKLSEWGVSKNDINVIDKKNKVYIQGKINIVSYKKFASYTDIQYISEPHNLLIIDECHRMKNFQSKTFHRIIEEVGCFEHTLLISATLIGKNNVDLFAPVFTVHKSLREMYGYNYNKFAHENVVYKNIWVGSGKTRSVPDYINTLALNTYIYPYIYQITYEQAGLVRPAYSTKRVTFEITDKHRVLLDSEIKNTIGNDLESLSVEELDALNENRINNNPIYQQVCNCFRYIKIESETGDKIPDEVEYFSMDSKYEQLVNIIEEEPKTVLFYKFKGELAYLKNKLGSLCYVYKVETDIDGFEKSDKKVMLCQFQQLGEGVRFKKSSCIVEFSLIYNYTDLLQVYGRLQYAGRKDTYTIYRFDIEHEATKKIHDNILNKQQINLKERSNIQKIQSAKK